MRILVLRGGALGDFLVTLPALRALRTRWPEATIEWVGNRPAAQLAVAEGSLQRAHDQHEARWAALHGDDALPVELDRWLRSFDLLVNYWPDPDGDLARRFASWGPRYVHGDANVSRAPAARQFLEPLERLGCRSDDLAPRLDLPQTAHEAAARALAGRKDLIALHPGSGSRRKNWPLSGWQEVARRLEGPLLWISGEAEAGQEPPAEVEVIRAERWPLTTLAAALSTCRLYLGHDTGVSHLAAASGAAGVLLFGPTDPAVWAPPTSRMRVLRAPGGALDRINVEDVVAAALAADPRQNATA